MPKTITIDPGVLQAALVGYEMQRNRIEAAIAEIQAQLGDGGSGRSSSTATTIAEPKATSKRRFSSAARKRMAAAQRKRWQLLKAKKAEAAKPRRKSTAKRRKATAAAPARKPPVQVRAAKNVAPKPKAKRTAPKPKGSAAEAPKAAVETTATPIEVALDPAPATA